MKILYVTTISNTVNAFLIPHIKMLLDEGHQVDVAFNIVQEVNPTIFEMGCKVYNIEFQRSPLNKQNISAYIKIKKLIQDEQYDLVHTHTPVASACVRLACRKMDNVKVIYTAHGFHFYNGAPILNWVVYYPIEKWLSKYTDIIITINKEDNERARSSFHAKRVEYVPGVGLDIKKIQDVSVDKLKKRKELGIPRDAFLVLSVGEINKNKNHETVIRAISKLNNPKIYYVICGEGVLKNDLLELVKELGFEKQIKFLGFRRDIHEICIASDIFVFPSFREGLSVALMEAMASGLPVVCSNIRGNLDLIEDGKNGLLVNASDVDGFTNAINSLYNSVNLREEFQKNSLEKIKNYSLENVLREIEKVTN